MAGAGAAILFGVFFVVLGGIGVYYPDRFGMGWASPATIESDPEAAAAQARRSIQLRGQLLVALGLVLLLLGVVGLF
ncbi:hypothetical protein NDI56_19610 [Haloarcula sp. S1CR25-12]|uniref:Uncharacterized protein n=1 Tax=Haloarcula saliterrae TaxID=2950534 RepID=A0ABU2FH85_9EURY|nr:hypothetical protein [Haloarcula sp. S1CR25-12]MDS0261613.1 hypothetical protein [Haloarcula sp. S1CR25-12]